MNTRIASSGMSATGSDSEDAPMTKEPVSDRRSIESEIRQACRELRQMPNELEQLARKLQRMQINNETEEIARMITEQLEELTKDNMESTRGCSSERQEEERPEAAQTEVSPKQETKAEGESEEVKDIEEGVRQLNIKEGKAQRRRGGAETEENRRNEKGDKKMQGSTAAKSKQRQRQQYQPQTCECGRDRAACGQCGRGWAQQDRQRQDEIFDAQQRAFEEMIVNSGCVSSCVECGITTSCWCDGGTIGGNSCVAREFINDETGNIQNSPICTVCDRRYGTCRYCRGVSACTPAQWSGIDHPEREREREREWHEKR